MKVFIVLIISAVACGYLFSIVSNIIDNDEFYLERGNIETTKNSRSPFDGRIDNLFWFVQVTDIHVSKFWDYKRSPDLLLFCKDYLTVINPDFVLVTGDLTDAKFVDKRRSKQFEEEWKLYKETVTKCRELNNDVRWLDLRGNHDAFNVPTHDDPRNLFRQYSIQGGNNPSSYHYTHTKPYGKYSFVAMDATPDPGPRRPFNFFGFLNNKQRSRLELFSREASDSNMVIWFGHYTTSLIVPEDEGDVRRLMSNATAYLCGHLHTLADLVPRMYTLHKTGTLELELGDWKDNRKFRILAIDHDILSFTDETLGSWPAVIITNPVHAMYASPKDSPGKIINSTHIRILIFSPFDITKVKVTIDDTDELGEASHVKGPLYVLPWKPAKYDTGIHKIRVLVEDKKFYKKEVIQPFSLDGSRPAFALLPRLVLMMNIYSIGKLVFQFLASIYMIVLFLLRRCDDVTSILMQTESIFSPLVTYINTWITRVWYVTRMNSLYYTLLGFMLYIWIGPWFIAEVIDGHMGVVCLWGMYVKGTFLPGSLTYIYGVFQIVTFNIPFLLFMGYMLHFNTTSLTRSTVSSLSRKIRHIYIPFCSIVLLQTYVAITEFPKAYGTTAFLLGPVRTGSVILALVLFYYTKDVRITVVSTRRNHNHTS